MACRGPLAAVLGLLVVATACVDDDRSFAQFDGPTDVVILEPGELFEVPVALVTSFRSGRVTKLDLKRRSVLVGRAPEVDCVRGHRSAASYSSTARTRK